MCRFFIIGAIIICLFSSCYEEMKHNKNANNAAKYLEDTVYDYEKYIEEIIQRNPSLKENTIVRVDVEDSISKSFIKSFKNGGFENIPFKFKDIGNYGEESNPKYLAIFDFDNSNYPPHRIARKSVFSIFTFIKDKSLAKGLVNGSTYFLRGRFNSVENKRVVIYGEYYLPNIRIDLDSVVLVKKQ